MGKVALRLWERLRALRPGGCQIVGGPNYNLAMPRKVILGFGISIDGYIARRNGAMDYLVIDKEGEALMADFFANIDTTIMGRKTAAATAEMRKRGEIPDMPGMSTYVFSRRWKPGKRDGFEVVSGSLTAFVKKLKRHEGKDIYLGGGASCAAVSCKRIWSTNSTSVWVPFYWAMASPPSQPSSRSVTSS
jgi:dihydrofolate reductase